VTRYPAYREDVLEESAFEQYTKKHYNSWVTFSKPYGANVKPVLVTGFDMTKDFAMTAYSNNGPSESNLSISVPKRDSTSTSSAPTRASASAFFEVESSNSAYTNSGPQQCIPPLSAQVLDTPLETTSAEPVSNDSNQCVFLRYYTIRKRMGLFPVLIRAAAGPHDLGPGDNHDSTFPELMAQQDPTSNHEDDPTSGAEDAHSDPNNAPDVWYLSCPLVSALIINLRARGTASSTFLQIMYSR
jgi:hypothetical protein